MSPQSLIQLTYVFGRLDPSHPLTGQVLRIYEEVIAEIPSHRLMIPDGQIFGEAGILTGIVARSVGIQASDRQPMLNDALMLLQAARQGQTFLTRNISDVDYLQQLFPQAKVLFYRQIP